MNERGRERKTLTETERNRRSLKDEVKERGREECDRKGRGSDREECNMVKGSRVVRRRGGRGNGRM